MKVIDYINQSLSNKVVSLLVLCFLIFIAGMGSLFYFQHQAEDEYIEKRENIEAKLKPINYIYNEFNSYVLVMSNSLAVRVPTNKEEALSQEKELRRQLNEFGKLTHENTDEGSAYHNFDRFITYYFSDVIPPIMMDYGQNQDPSADLSNSEANFRIPEFLSDIKSFKNQLEEQLSDNAKGFSDTQSLLQNSLITFFIIFLLLLVMTIRRIFKSVGKPLAEFTFSANEIAAGRDAVIKVDPKRKDELGTLSTAFQKMVQSIQNKEQDLIAHNEELIAQQDELQIQQEELQSTLKILTENEQQLIRRNELINGISSSLDKEEVLQSIIENMCKVTGSDKGILTYLEEEAFAAYGLSSTGVELFRRNLINGFVLRLTSEKKPFTVKREQHPLEKGYHETTQYCYDLYLPIISSSHVEAVLVFTRYGDAFSKNEVTEYETLSKQIAIYLEKIKLFEQSDHDRRLNQNILNTVQEGIQLIDKDRKIIQVNQQLYKFFKGSDTSEKLLGLSWDQWSPMMARQVQEKEFITFLNELIDSAIQSPEEEHSFIYRKNDSNQVIRVYCKTFKNESDEEFGTLLVHHDITKEHEVAQMKSEFVSTVSHELRTPLASVLGFTELLLTKELKPERQEKYLKTIYKEAKRLTALINDFLDIQKMESGKQSYEKKYINLTSILQQVMELQAISTSIHEITLSVELEETIILGDKSKMKQVFTNLLSNAIKYSPNGGNILIRIYEDNGMISVDFKDEGLGIPEEAIPNLFQQFYRVDNSDRRKIGGTGLGLTIVQEIVKAHGGNISVSSEYGKGSTFSMQFPQAYVIAEKQSNQKTDSLLQYTIMVIEDDLSLAQLLQLEFQENGFQVNHFNSGKKALEQMKKEAPNVIVLDIMLEDEIDGWFVMKEMKASEELKDIPIFISTAMDDKERGFSLGAEDYLTKPYNPSQLTKLIMQTLLRNEKNGQIMVPH